MSGVRFRSYCASVALAAALFPTMANAQPTGKGFPAKPITLIVPYAPGNTDIIARIYLTQISKNTGWTFTYDYKPGAAGTIGANLAAKSTPDGYTMLMISSTITLGHLMQKKPPYNWQTDFIPVYQMTKTPPLLIVSPSLPVKTAQEYIAYGKKYPGKINYGTVGTGGITSLVATWMHHVMGIKVTYVPYKGYGPISAAMLSGEVHASHPSPKAFLSYIQSGKLRAVATLTANARVPQLPNVRSLAEQGVPDFDYSIWIGAFYPRGTPATIVNRMNAEFNKAAKGPEVIKRFADLGEGFGGGTPEDFKKLAERTAANWSKVVAETGIVLSD